MKGIAFLSGFITSLLTWGIILPVNSQITSDNTTNTIINPSGNNFNIINGIQKGNNLFHSFKEFSIPKGNSATFNNSTDVVNIINRVTGGNISNIDGLIKANGNANLFLINPAGIVFGENAKLDIGGSFLGTTAESVLFEDGFEFSAINSQDKPLLTVSIPMGLQMGNNPGDIEINGSGFVLDLSSLAFSVISNSDLQVKTGENLALLGGNINMTGSRISTDAGKVELGSVSQGYINLNPTSTGWDIDYNKVSEFGDIKFNQGIIEALTPGGGSINLQARNIFLDNGSGVIIQNQGLQRSDGIQINSTESLHIKGVNPRQSLSSFIYSQALLGSVEDIFISTKRLISSGGVGIQSVATNAPGSNITINASELIKLEPSPLRPTSTSGIETSARGNEKAGNVFISTGNLQLLGGSRVASITRGEGNSGDVNIDAKSIEVNGITTSLIASLISAGSLAEGDAGNLYINTYRLTIRDGGRVDSSAAAQGNAGNVTINAKEFVEVNGTVPGSINPSLIISSANLLDESLRQTLRLPTIPTGESGNVTIHTPELRVLNGGLVTVKNDGTGNAGNLEISGNSIFLNDTGSISAETQSGEGGNININLQESLIMRHAGIVDTESLGTGNGGNITINSPVIVGLENSDIIANAFEGNGGNIDIATQGIFGLKFRDQLTEESDISASSQFGVNGTVKINNIAIDPSSGLVELSSELSDSSQQIASGCFANGDSSFVATGKGGIPQNPSEQIEINNTWSDIRDLSTFRKPSNNYKVTSINKKPEIVEATSFIRNENGEIELVAAQNKPLQIKKVPNCSGFNT